MVKGAKKGRSVACEARNYIMLQRPDLLTIVGVKRTARVVPGFHVPGFRATLEDVEVLQGCNLGTTGKNLT